MLAEVRDLEQELVEDIASFEHDPVGFVKYAFPWGDGELKDASGPREWQAKVLNAIGAHLGNTATRFHPLRIAVSSGHGIGKSALIAMITAWGLGTHQDCKITTTANTGTQLNTKTVPEASKWFRLAINAHWWDVNATSIRVKDAAHEKTWRCDYIPWSIHNPQAFAGMHNKGNLIVLVFDEASEIDDVIWEVAEGALTDENTEIVWLAFGNPTQNTGRFRECFGRFSHRWLKFQIDARNVEGTNKVEQQKWLEDYGEDSDWFRIKVRGEFPRAGSNQFIAGDVVAECRKYKAIDFATLPKIISVDVARFGDDETVVIKRQGRKAETLAKWRGLDTVQVAERVIKLMEEEQPDGTVVDADGLGAGVVDQIRFRGFGKRLFEFHGGAAADDANAYFNRRAEVWGIMRDALKAQMQIPDDPDLDADLTSVQYGLSNKSQIQLEKKADMKARGLRSPDAGDALAMSFAVKVAAPKAVAPKKYQYPGQGAQNWMGG